MDNKNIYFIIGGITAFLFYILFMLLLFFYFNEFKSKRFIVPKKSKEVEVSLIQFKPKPKIKKKSIKKIDNKTTIQKNSVSTSSKYNIKVKKEDISSLFGGLKVEKPKYNSYAIMANAPKIKYKKQKIKKDIKNSAKKIVENMKFENLTIKAKNPSKDGEFDKYISKIYEIIYATWEPESIYAGLEATVLIEILPSGDFKFKISIPSNNQSFNESLLQYLNELKDKMLPKNSFGKKIKLEIIFKPKE